MEEWPSLFQMMKLCAFSCANNRTCGFPLAFAGDWFLELWYIPKADLGRFSSPLATLPLLFRSSNWHTFLWSQESGGSARTDYRAIQLVKKKKQKGTGSDEGEAECAAVLVGKGLRFLVSQSQAQESTQNSCFCVLCLLCSKCPFINSLALYKLRKQVVTKSPACLNMLDRSKRLWESEGFKRCQFWKATE